MSYSDIMPTLEDKSNRNPDMEREIINWICAVYNERQDDKEFVNVKPKLIKQYLTEGYIPKKRKKTDISGNLILDTEAMENIDRHITEAYNSIKLQELSEYYRSIFTTVLASCELRRQNKENHEDAGYLSLLDYNNVTFQIEVLSELLDLKNIKETKDFLDKFEIKYEDPIKKFSGERGKKLAEILQ